MPTLNQTWVLNPTGTDLQQVSSCLADRWFRLIGDRQCRWTIDLVKGNVLLVGFRAHASRFPGEHHDSIFTANSFARTAAMRFHNSERIRSGKMRRNIFIGIVGVVLLFGSAVSSQAQVKRVQMHIAGYLCGN